MMLRMRLQFIISICFSKELIEGIVKSFEAAFLIFICNLKLILNYGIINTFLIERLCNLFRLSYFEDRLLASSSSSLDLLL